MISYYRLRNKRFYFSEIKDIMKKELCLIQKSHQVKRSNWVEILTDGRWKSNQNETNLLMDVGSPIATVIWNNIQKESQCCGMSGQQDWLNSHFGKIPPSCCNPGKTMSKILTQFLLKMY
jgi:hypothetical protein